MAATFSYQGKLMKLDVVRVQFLNTLTLHLFQNNHTPDCTEADPSVYTEATFPGYSAQSILDFGAPTLDGICDARTTTGLYTFLDTGPTPANTIYGYYITDDGGVLIASELNPAGTFLMDAAGKIYVVRLSDLLT